MTLIWKETLVDTWAYNWRMELPGEITNHLDDPVDPHERAWFELFDALLADYAEAVEEIGLSYYEDRLAWWCELRGIDVPEAIQQDIIAR